MRLLEQEGWRPNTLSRRDLAAALGKAVHAGLHAWYLGIVPVAYMVEKQWAETRAAWGDRMLPDYLQAQHDAILPRALRVADALPKLTHTLPHWDIRAVEQTLPRGRIRPDLIIHDGISLAPVDWKVSLNLTERDEPFRRARYAHSWQLNHYCWEIQDAFKEPCRTAYIGQVVVEPKPRIIIWDYPITEEALTMWASSARRVWAQMELEDKGEAEPWQAAEHSDQFGECPYYRACFVHQYDAGLMALDYVKGGRD